MAEQVARVMEIDDLPPVPAHVPDELVWYHALPAFAQASREDPYIELSRELHAGPDLRWCPRVHMNSPAWVPTRYELIQEILLNPELFSSEAATEYQKILGVDWLMAPLELDPPVHNLFRQMLQPRFQPSVVKSLENSMRADCVALLEPLVARGSCEFFSEFSLLFPSTVFLRLMGLPLEQSEQFLEWERQQFRGTAEERVASVRNVVAYLREYMAVKRKNPTDDLASYIATAKINGRLLTDDEISGLSLILYTGGLDTVTSSLGWYFRNLVTDRALQDRMRADPSCIPDATNEYLRAFGVTQQARRVTRDVTFHGVDLKQGEIIVTPTYLASRDERAYPDPHRIDIDRKVRHLTLATGPHNCLGIHIAKREIQIVFEEWLKRCRNIRMQPGEKAEWFTGGVWSITRLPIAWDPI